MASEQEQIRALAERVARRLSTPAGQESGAGGGGGTDDIAALRAGLDEIQRRLARIESRVEPGDARADNEREAGRPPQARGESSQRRDEEAARDATPARSLWLSGTYVPAVDHPSQDRFGIGEAVSEMVDFLEREKTCQLEPGDKPCDHCAMCSTRGF
jgi:hypothetical protein